MTIHWRTFTASTSFLSYGADTSYLRLSWHCAELASQLHHCLFGVQIPISNTKDHQYHWHRHPGYFQLCVFCPCLDCLSPGRSPGQHPPHPHTFQEESGGLPSGLSVLDYQSLQLDSTFSDEDLYQVLIQEEGKCSAEATANMSGGAYLLLIAGPTFPVFQQIYSLPFLGRPAPFLFSRSPVEMLQKLWFKKEALWHKVVSLLRKRGYGDCSVVVSRGGGGVHPVIPGHQAHPGRFCLIVDLSGLNTVFRNLCVSSSVWRPSTPTQLFRVSTMVGGHGGWCHQISRMPICMFPYTSCPISGIFGLQWKIQPYGLPPTTAPPGFSRNSCLLLQLICMCRDVHPYIDNIFHAQASFARFDVTSVFSVTVTETEAMSKWD